MKRFLLILLLIAPVLAAIVIAVGYVRGNSCPAYIGNAYYQLKPSVDPDSIEPLLLEITEKYGSNYERWPDSKTPEEGIAAYRRSLRYTLSKNADGYLLHISSLANIDWVAVDAPVFPGMQAYYPLLRDGYLDGLSTGHRVTEWEKIKHGLGLFPIGQTLPEVM